MLKVLCFLGMVWSAAAVSITKCRAEDSACMKLSAQAFVPILAEGIPEIGSKSLEPLLIEKIDASSSNLKLHANGLVVKGLKGCTIPDISRDTAKNKLFVDVLCTVDVQAEYNIKGKILVLPIDGSGHLSIQLYKILISVEVDLKDVIQNGKKYWNIAAWDYKFDLKERANIELKGLFGGSPELTQAMRELMGESANEIIKEVGPPIVKGITSEVVDAVNHLFNHIPVEELALD